MNKDDVGCLIILLVIVPILTFWMGINITASFWKNEAVSVKAAEYRVDDRGNVTFHWLATQTLKLMPELNSDSKDK